LKAGVEERAKLATQECERQAAEYVTSEVALDTAKSTAIVAGAVTGGAIEAVTGNPRKRRSQGGLRGWNNRLLVPLQKVICRTWEMSRHATQALALRAGMLPKL
jgi:hypothetical protein